MTISSSNVFVKNQTVSSRHSRASFSKLNVATERRRGDLIRNVNSSATTHVVRGSNSIDGSGEILLDVAFPVVFIQPPIFLYGAELAPGNVLVSGSFPVMSALVHYWDVDQPDLELFGSTRRQHFRGAQLAITATGPETQRMFLHWQFTGMAVTNAPSLTVPDGGDLGQVIS